MTRLAERTARIASSPTMKVTATVDRLRREGVEVIDFGAGEPDFGTPASINAAAHDAIDQDFTKYTPVAGIAELKRAICDRYRTDYGVEYTESEVITSAGGKQALYNTALALFSAGDEVITHAPCWPTLSEQVKLAEATPVLVRTSAKDGFAIKAQPILDAITPRTRGIIINSPCNPTGALISGRRAHDDREGGGAPRHLGDPRSLLREADLRADAAQSAGRAQQALPRSGGDLRIGVEGVCDDRLALRLDAGAGICCRRAKRHSEPHDLQRVVDHAEGGPGGSHGIAGPVTAMLNEYRRRRDNLHQWLTADPRIRCTKPGGAFYLFPDISDALSPQGLATSADFAQALLEEARVAVTPGEAFDAPGFVRISYATSMENLREGSRRLVEFVAANRRGPAFAHGN